MVPTFLRINGVTRANRDETLSQVRFCISAAGAWVLDVKLFSNVSVCMTFEMPIDHADQLRQGLAAMELHLTAESHDALAVFSEYKHSEAAGSPLPDVTGTLQITFIHNEPDLKIEVPRIPG